MRVLALLCVIFSCLTATAETQTFRTKTGQYAGSAYSSGSRTVYRNSTGQYAGSGYYNGGRTSFRGATGSYSGSASGRAVVSPSYFKK